ncbi:MAG: hypothetical protein VYC34_08955, partial [Planctomycetota bacterium]|nr:hypothetical protein [Planctomycetota bacterium]
MPTPRRALALIVLFILTGAAHAAPAGPPEGAIAWWSFDPSRFAAASKPSPERIAMTSLLRAIVAGRVIESESVARILEGILAASEVGALPHTLAVLDFEAERGPEAAMSPTRLQMTLELDTARDHARFLRTLQAILVDAERVARAGDEAKPLGAQRQIALPGEKNAVAYTEPDWPAWREISWMSTDAQFVVALGRDAIPALVEARSAAARRGEPAAWLAHRAVVDRTRPEGEVFLEAYLSIDALRQGFPDAFSFGRARRTFEALNLSNARDVMLHARWVDPPADSTNAPAFIALDVTWSARSEAPGVIRHKRISEDRWPGRALEMDPPPGSYVMVVAAEWDSWFDQCLEIALG